MYFDSGDKGISLTDSSIPPIAPVKRSHDEARANYDRLAGWYDLVASPFEEPHRHRMVELLDVARAESILEVGFGTGDVLCELTSRVGAPGTVAGIDIPPRMLQVATQKLRGAGLVERTDLRMAGIPVAVIVASPQR